MRPRFLLLTLAALATLGLMLAACGDDDDDGGGATATRTAAASSSGGGQALDVTITASDFKFDKTTLTAKKGQTVNITLVNDGSAPHSFTVGDEDVADVAGGEDGDGTFTASDETTEFHCKYHANMTGTISVN